jgi:hypothetical protein
MSVGFEQPQNTPQPAPQTPQQGQGQLFPAQPQTVPEQFNAPQGVTGGMTPPQTHPQYPQPTATVPQAQPQPQPAPSPSSAMAAPDGSASPQGHPVNTTTTDQVQPQPGYEPVAQQPQNPLLDRFRADGIDLPYTSDDEAIRAIADLQRQREANQQYAQLGQQVASQWDQFQQFQQSQSSSSADASEPDAWGAPEFDPSWERQVTQDANGNIIPREGQPPEVASKYNRYMTWMADRLRSVMHNPGQELMPALQPQIEQLVQQRVHEALTNHSDQQAWRDFANQNRSWMVHTDAQGQPRADQLRGGPLFTELGKKFQDHLNNAINMGIQGAQNQIKYAQSLIQPELAQQQQHGNGNQNGVSAEQQYNDKLNFFRQQAMRPESYGASTAPQVGVQNTRLDPRATLLNEFSKMYANDAQFNQDMLHSHF